MDLATERLAALLGPLTNYERDRPDRARFGLESMRALLAQIESPDAALVQIGGSKGKGSTALYLEHLAHLAGLRVGTYLSPHLQSILERVRLNRRQVGEDVLRRALESVLDAAQRAGIEISFFEAMTAAAIDCFHDAAVDLGILEVGLGGRLDATTAVAVDASILTGIECEHTEILGDSIASIAAEKAFVIREKGLCLTSAQGPALAVFVDRATEVEAELCVMGQDFGIKELRCEADAWLGTLWMRGGMAQQFRLPDAPRIELDALALAWACMMRVFPGCELTLSALDRPEMPGRFEVIRGSSGAPIVLDGAHTEASLGFLGAELTRRYGSRKRRFLYASAAGKRWRQGLGSILQSADEILVTGLSDTRSEDPATICEHLRGVGYQARVVSDVGHGLRALQVGEELAVVTGSFYLVGEARERLMK